MAELRECLYCFLLFFRMYAYLREGECDVTTMSHVTVMDAIDGWQRTPSMVGNGRHRWLATDAIDGWQWTPSMVGMDAIDGWPSQMSREV